jgi:hypothetical protein
MLAVLRLTYDVEADFIRTGCTYIQMTSFVEEGQRLDFRMNLWHEVFKNFKVNVQNVHAVFCETAKMKEIVRLCSDTLHAAPPLQYSYLSLYKLFELDFKNGKQWRNFLTPFEEEFQRLGLAQMTLFRFIKDLRDKCAHIALGRRDRLGIVGLESPDARLVEAFMPLFWKIAAHHLNAKCAGLIETSVFQLVPPRRAD